VSAETLVIYNPLAGENGKADPKHALDEFWPGPADVVRVNTKQIHPDEIKEYKTVLVWGGDGTVGTVLQQFPEVPVVPLHMGTVGDIAQSLGLGKKLGETQGQYLHRVAEMKLGGRIEVLRICPGLMVFDENLEERFVWTGGVGASVEVLRLVETYRNEVKTKIGRTALGALGYLGQLMISGPEMDMTLPGGTKHKVIDINMINAPFARFGGLPLTCGNSILWLEKPQSAEEKHYKLAALVVDAGMAKLRSNFTGKAFQLTRLEEGSFVTVEGPIASFQRDSEINAHTALRMIMKKSDCGDSFTVSGVKQTAKAE